MNKIEISYNPYRSLSRIVIGDSPVAEHSELAKYMKEPFHLWCDEIFHLIANELNDEYELIFTSNFLECEIMKSLGNMATDCKSVKTSSCTVNVTTQQRVDAFLGAQKITANYTINLLTPSGLEHLLRPLISTMTKQGVGSYEINAGYTNCKVSVSSGASVKFSTAPNMLNVLISDNPNDWQQLPKNCSDGKPALFICVDDKSKTGFYAKYGEVYCYSCEISKLQKLLMRFLEFACITPDLQRRFAKLRQAKGGTYTTSLAFEALDSIDPVISVGAPTTLEVGKRYNLNIQVFPVGSACPPLTFDCVPNGIVRCDKGVIEALSGGRAEVTVYPKGGVEACSRFTVDALARNRITQLTLPHGNLVLPEGEVSQIALEFFPDNADNANTIQWVSSDNRVARVKPDGRVKAMATGKCNISATAENVTVTCSLTVKPVISQITLTEKKVHLYIGESGNLEYSFTPANAYDPKVSIKIDDPTIVEYKNGKLLPRCVGKTNISFASNNGGASASCEVTVGSSYQARSKGNFFVPLAALLCIFSFFVTSIIGIALAGAGCICTLLGFIQSKKTVTLFMILTIIGCLVSIGLSVMQILN